jgi:hypothetical protein
MALQAGRLLRAWRSWVEHTAASLHKRQLLRVAAARIADHHAHAAFSTWHVSPSACIQRLWHWTFCMCSCCSVQFSNIVLLALGRQAAR